VFPVPKALLTPFSRLPGLDGTKMSKSKGNTILLSDPPDEIEKKVRLAVTDPAKVRMGDPGHPEICTVFTYHKKFNPDEVPEIERDCRSGVLGCVACKKNLAQKLADYLAPLREKRKELEGRRNYIREVILEGNRKAREEAQATMDLVREKMKIGKFWDV
jgi:tryptophanyl-tRNA synthetase